MLKYIKKTCESFLREFRARRNVRMGIGKVHMAENKIGMNAEWMIRNWFNFPPQWKSFGEIHLFRSFIKDTLQGEI